jgi:Spy/CpxP family protein refolding chaperone
MMCHEYGWTIDQVFDCTREQLDALSKSMTKRKQAEMEFIATINGAQIKKTSHNTVDAAKDFDKLKKMGIPTVEE